MFSVGIVVPTWHYFRDAFKLQPVEELYFATVIDSRFGGKDVNVNVIDLRELRKEDSKYSLDQVSEYIPEHDLYLYWISRAGNHIEILSVIDQLRQAYPKSKHAAGGFHIESLADECERQFDAIIFGPGEESFINIINDCRNGSLKKMYICDWKNVKFSDYPFPRRHYLTEPAVVNTELFKEYGNARGTSALFSRGCPFKCAFCYTNFPNMLQMRNPQSIEEEIIYLKKEYQIQGINLRDELCIPLSKRPAIKRLEVIGRHDIIWRGQGRVGTSKEVLALASQSGCVEIAVGVESVSQQVLDIVRKEQTVEQARDFIHLCKQSGIKVKMCVIFGLPGEPPDIVDMTRSFIEDAQPDYVNVSALCPFPGTEIFNNSGDYGIKYIDKAWSKYGHLMYRFSEDEHFGLPFEYDETNRWGKTFSRDEIIKNMQELQHYLRERGMSY